VTDAAGRVVTLPSTVNRIADPWHANNAMVLMLGGADKLVATTVQAQRQPWLRRLYPASRSDTGSLQCGRRPKRRDPYRRSAGRHFDGL